MLEMEKKFYLLQFLTASSNFKIFLKDLSNISIAEKGILMLYIYTCYLNKCIIFYFIFKVEIIYYYI